MPWIIVSANGEEFDRRELTAALTVGRSGDCDLAVRDPLLSRAHCRIEPVGRGGLWRVVDLNSKNGTRVGWQKTKVHVLRDGDHLRMGRTRVQFFTGFFQPAPVASKAPRPDRLIRPADPHEALTGTVTDFVLLDEETAPELDPFFADRPFPQPRPLDPASYTAPDTQTLLDDLAAASGGVSLMALPRQQKSVARALPKFSHKTIYREIRRPAGVAVDDSLQAEPSCLPAEVIKIEAPRPISLGARLAIGAALVVTTAGVLGSLWLLTMMPK